MRTAVGEIRHSRLEQRRIDAARRTRPLFSGITHGCRHDEVWVARLQSLQLRAKDKIAGRPEAEDEGDPARPARFGEIARDAHQRCDTDSRADQDETLRLLAIENE